MKNLSPIIPFLLILFSATSFSNPIGQFNNQLDTKLPFILETQPDYHDWIQCVSSPYKSAKEKAEC